MTIKTNHKTSSLAVAIISYNEEARIAQCLESVLPIADEIVIVDSRSTDNTVVIAESMGAKVYSEDWKGFVAQKNSVLEKCSCQWVLFLDCDEVLSGSLRENIAAAIKSNECNGYQIKRISFFMGHWIKHAWGMDWCTRLVKREKAVWTGQDVHETLECPEPVKKIEGDAYHYTYLNYEQHMTKGVHYAALGAQSLCKRGKRVRLYMLFTNPLWCFIKHYIVKAGFLDGFPGFIISLTSLHHNFYKYLIAWEMQNSESPDSPLPSASGTSIDNQ